MQAALHRSRGMSSAPAQNQIQSLSLVSLDVNGYLDVRTGRTARLLGLNANHVLCYWELLKTAVP